MGETGEMADHVVGEIQSRQGDKVSEALQLSELERSLEIDTTVSFTVRRSILLL